MDSYSANREALAVSKALTELNDAINNDKDLSDLATIMAGLGLHTYWWGLELEKDPASAELGKKMTQLGKHWHKHGDNLQNIALSRMNSHAAD
jgi:hypothetical protein